MALSDYLKRGQIGPSLKGQYYQYERNGRWVTAKWPKKRGPARSQKQKNAEIAFAEACFAMKRTASEIQMFHRENAKGTPMLPRDSLMAALYGNGPTVRFYNGKVIKPMANKYLASTVLDAIGWEPGSMLYRGPDAWEVIPPGEDGLVLEYSEALKRPQWVTGGDPGAARRAFWVPYLELRSSNPGLKVNFYRCFDDITIRAIRFVHQNPADRPLRLQIAGCTNRNTIGPVIHDFGLVGTLDGNFRVDRVELPYPVTFPSGEFFAIAIIGAYVSTIRVNLMWSGTGAFGTIPMLRPVQASTGAGYGLVPGEVYSPVTNPIWAISIEA